MFLSAPLGKRTGVWSEPGKLKAAVWEFKRDTELYLETAESLTSPYSWGRYDMLVLPYVPLSHHNSSSN